MKRLLTLLVGLFPGPFRRQFGSDLLEQIETDYDKARTTGGCGPSPSRSAPAWISPDPA